MTATPLFRIPFTDSEFTNTSEIILMLDARLGGFYTYAKNVQTFKTRSL